MMSQAVQNSTSTSHFIALFFTTPMTAFGAGIIAQASELYEYNAGHGDIGNLLAPLPLSF